MVRAMRFVRSRNRDRIVDGADDSTCKSVRVKREKGRERKDKKAYRAAVRSKAGYQGDERQRPAEPDERQYKDGAMCEEAMKRHEGQTLCI